MWRKSNCLKPSHPNILVTLIYLKRVHNNPLVVCWFFFFSNFWSFVYLWCVLEMLQKSTGTLSSLIVGGQLRNFQFFSSDFNFITTYQLEKFLKKSDPPDYCLPPNWLKIGDMGRLGQKNLLIYVIALSFFFPKWSHVFHSWQNFLFYENFCEGENHTFWQIAILDPGFILTIPILLLRMSVCSSLNISTGVGTPNGLCTPDGRWPLNCLSRATYMGWRKSFH